MFHDGLIWVMIMCMVNLSLAYYILQYNSSYQFSRKKIKVESSHFNKIQKLVTSSVSITTTLKITRAEPLCNKNISRDVKDRGRLKNTKYNGRQHRRLC